MLRGSRVKQKEIHERFVRGLRGWKRVGWALSSHRTSKSEAIDCLLDGQRRMPRLPTMDQQERRMRLEVGDDGQ
jgi:hypothetical protein